MNKVFTVMDITDYYGPYLKEIFETYEKAQSWIDNTDYPTDFEIIEWEVK